MKPDGDGFADAVLPADRRARLRGRPSGLKGRYRDRCPTGLRPALDPAASTAPHRAVGTGRRTAPCPPEPHGARLISRSNPYKQSLYGFRGLPGSLWDVGPISNTNGTLSTTATQQNANEPGWACGRALAQRNNVLIDVNTCSADPADSAVNIANQIAARVPT